MATQARLALTALGQAEAEAALGRAEAVVVVPLVLIVLLAALAVDLRITAAWREMAPQGPRRSAS
jgi:hypothetical protein